MMNNLQDYPTVDELLRDTLEVLENHEKTIEILSEIHNICIYSLNGHFKSKAGYVKDIRAILNEVEKLL